MSTTQWSLRCLASVSLFSMIVLGGRAVRAEDAGADQTTSPALPPSVERDHLLRGASVNVNRDAEGHRWDASAEGKQSVLDLWSAQPGVRLASFEEILEFTRQIPIESSVPLSPLQRDMVVQTVAEFVSAQMLPAAEAARRLTDYHTKRGATPNLGQARANFAMNFGPDATVPADVPAIIEAVMGRGGDQRPWRELCPAGCLIEIRQVNDAKEMFRPVATYLPLGTGFLTARRGASVFYDAISTLEEALAADPDHKALVAEVTLLARHSGNSARPGDETWPVVHAFHWEPLVDNWVMDARMIPAYVRVPASAAHPIIESRAGRHGGSEQRGR